MIFLSVSGPKKNSSEVVEPSEFHDGKVASVNKNGLNVGEAVSHKKFPIVKHPTAKYLQGSD